MPALAFAPARFIREVRAEAAKVTWPSRKETMITTALVVVMAVVTALFFFSIDLAAGWAVRTLFTGAGPGAA
jgi:preprotein translocase subunit SecE